MHPDSAATLVSSCNQAINSQHQDLLYGAVVTVAAINVDTVLSKQASIVTVILLPDVLLQRLTDDLAIKVVRSLCVNAYTGTVVRGLTQLNRTFLHAHVVQTLYHMLQ